MLSLCLLAALLVAPVRLACTNQCLDCQQEVKACFACDLGSELDVYGSCHNNTISNCVIYGQNGQCLGCRPTFKLELNKCIRDFSGCILFNNFDQSCFDCGFGTTLSDTGKCLGVLNCRQYSPEGLCKGCFEGYNLTNGICVDNTEGCSIVRSNDGLCQKCNPNFVMSGYMCFRESAILPQCYLQNPRGKCVVCKNGFKNFDGWNDCYTDSQYKKLRSTPQVIPQVIPAPEPKTATPTPPPAAAPTVENCQVPDFSNPRNCLICKQGYFSKGQQCQQVSILCNGSNVQTGACLGCKYNLTLYGGGCLDANCQGYLPGSFDCSVCKSGYNLSTEFGICIFNDINCAKTKVPLGCEVCAPGFYVNLTTGICNKLPSDCLQVNQATGKCTACSSNKLYVNVNSGACEPIPVIERCILANDTDPTQCLVCSYGWYPAKNQCLRVSPTCGSHNVQTGQCLTCYSSFLQLVDGRCVDPNCRIFTNLLCSECVFSYAYDSDSRACIYQDPNCLNQSKQECLRCKDGYFIYKDKKCRPLPQFCLIASADTGVCTECVADYEIVNQSCVEKFRINKCLQLDYATRLCIRCQAGYYLVNNNVACAQYQCINFDRYGNCKGCLQGYQLLSGLCQRYTSANVANMAEIKTNANTLPNLPNGEVSSASPSGSAEIVKNESTSETLVISPSNKTSPVENILNSNSLPSLNTTLVAKQTDSAVTSDPNPAVITPIPAIPNTSTSSQTQTKPSIQPIPQKVTPSIILNVSPNVPPALPPTTPQIPQIPPIPQSPQSLQANMDPYCIQSLGAQCIRCSVNFYKASNGRCVPVNPLCQSSNDRGECLSCYQGYALSGAVCVAAISSDPYCMTPGANRCLQCFRNYYFSTVSQICVRINPLCKQFNNQNGNCTSCYPGYQLQKGDCIVFIKDPNCIKYNDLNACVECSDRYRLAADAKCLQINQQCKTFDKSSGLCTSCFEGYANVGGQCTYNTGDKFCRLIQGSVCTLCFPGYYPNISGVCVEANIRCRTINQANGNCTSCFDGYALTPQNDCAVNSKIDLNCKIKSDSLGVCKQCYSGYVAIEGSCQLQNPLCKTINTSNGDCKSCWPGYVLINANCIPQSQVPKQDQPPSVSLDPYCIEYQGLKCVKCSAGFFFNQNSQSCQQLNPICKESNTTSGGCLSCYPGYILTYERCLVPSEIVIPYCLRNSGSQCLECINGYFLDNNKICSAVSILCKTYDSATGQCTSCISDHFLVSGTCIYISSYDPNCISYVSSYCSGCRPNFYLSTREYNCLPIDPNCISFNKQTNQCLACSLGVPQGASCRL